MAVNILSSDSTSQWTVNNAGDTYVLEEDVYLSVLGTAISGTGAVTNRKFQIDGHVVAESAGTGMFIGQDASNGGGSTITIGEKGSVLGELYGIVAHGGDLHFLNNGNVTGQTAGLYMTGDDNFAVNHGDIVGLGGAGVNSLGDNANLQNAGTISGDTMAIHFAGAYTLLTNTGTITSTSTSEFSSAIDFNGGTINNFGLISAAGGVGISSDGVNSVNIFNAGTIDGAVHLGDGSDHVVNDGGTVTHGIDLGDGSNTFIYKGGFIGDTVHGGTGDDQYWFYGETTDIGDSGGSNDSVHANVSMSLAYGIENLFLFGDADIDGRGNGLDNYIQGNRGDNRLFGLAGDDRFRADQGADRYDGGAGVDEVSYYYTDDGSVTVNLASGKGGGAAAGSTYKSIEDVVGSQYKDRIIGNGAANHIEGYQGNDMLTGGGGKDVFEFVDTHGADTITDFQDGLDKIELQYHINGFNADSFASIKDLISQKGDDVVIDFSSIHAGDKLILKHMDVSDLSASDFIFA